VGTGTHNAQAPPSQTEPNQGLEPAQSRTGCCAVAKLKRVFSVVDVTSDVTHEFRVHTRHDLVQSLHQLLNPPGSAEYPVECCRQIASNLWGGHHVNLPAHSYFMGPGRWEVITHLDLVGEL
jgi:hypothetical protein